MQNLISLNSIHLLTAFPLGFVLGCFYFGSLWVTVRQLPTTQWPIPWFLGSYLGRLIIILLGFYLVMDGHWERATVCLAGFTWARILLVRRFGVKRLPLESREE
ncbi:MAG: ATP synthase subunit I [Leptolyngbyaceae bacterium]|nr:ATP synthase subunit I [Leptolyngbyaceae bacterium]